ncbi:MAG: type II toxin-antitoxin system VapC family toxin [Kiritimatiellia bacterium]
MVIDASALIALLFAEPEAPSVASILSNTGSLNISAFSLLESRIVVGARKGPEGIRELEILFYTLEINVIPFDLEQSALATEAWHRYGKGRHPAGLNIGDCCSYALAAQLGQTLLYKGNDFGETDLLCQHV